MRVQPHLPSRPLVATVTSSSGFAACACSAANSPAPPDPRIRMSVCMRSRFMIEAPRTEAEPQSPPSPLVGEGWGGGCLFDSEDQIPLPARAQSARADLPHKGGGVRSKLQCRCISERPQQEHEGDHG